MTILGILLFSVFLSRSKIQAYNTDLEQSLAQQFQALDISIPSVDLSSSHNKQISILGQTGNVSLVTYQGAQNFTTDDAFTGRDLIYYNSNQGSKAKYIKLNSVDTGNITHITSLEPAHSDCFLLSGSGFIDNKDLSKQVLFNLSSLSYTEVFDESLSLVSTVLVDSDVVYLGGNFTYKNGHSAAMWNITSNKISTLPFTGFGNNSYIRSITKLNDDSVLFSGRFHTLDDDEYLRRVHYSTFNNSTQTVNNTVEITNTSLSANSTSQVQQLVSLKYGAWSNNDDSVFVDKNDFLCPELAGGQIASWIGNSETSSFSVTFLNSIRPSKFRIYTTTADPVSSFRVTLPNGGIVQLEYLDPFANALKSCDANCPLYSNITNSGTIFLGSNVTSVSFNSYYQDFALSPSLPMSGLTFSSLAGSPDSSTNSVSISGFQTFQSEFFVYANNSLNEPGCADINDHSTAVTSPSNWKTGFSSSYVQTTIDNDVPYVQYYPQINIIGNYSLNIYTPGCLQDSSCSSRGVMNATIYYEDNDGISQTSSTLVYQNNNEEKYDNIYTGYLYSVPYVTLSYHGGVSSGQSGVIMVADRLSISAEEIPNPVQAVSVRNSTHVSTSNITETASKNVTLAINGLLQYSSSNFSNENLNASMKIGNTSLNSFTTQNFVNRGLTNFSLFSTFANDTLILSSSDFNGIAKLELNDNNKVMNASMLSTNGNVTAVGVISGGLQMLFGNFEINNTELSSLYYNGSFDTVSQFQTSLDITNFQSLNMDDSLILAFDNAYFFNWTARNSLVNSSSFNLSLWSAGSNSNGDTLFNGGFLNQDLIRTASNNVQISGSLNDIGSLTLTNSDLYRYYSAAYINSSLSAFAVRSSTLQSTVLLVDTSSNVTSQLPISFDDYAIIETMRYFDDVLALTTNTSEIYVYNTSAVATVSQSSINDTSASIHSMVYFGSNSTMLLCGSFIIGSCNGTCLYNIVSKEWSPFFDNHLTGDVSQCQFNNDGELIFAGDLQISNPKAKFASLVGVNLTSSASVIYSTASSVPDYFAMADNGDLYTVSANKSVIAYSDGSTWTNLSTGNFFSNSPNFADIVLLPRASNSSSKRDDTSNDPVLLAVGSFHSDTYGEQKAVIYSGSGWMPYLASDSSSGDGVALNAAQIFSNKDISQQISSNLVLKSHLSASNTSQSHESSSVKKMDRGYIVLLGLALSLGTTAAIGLLCILLVVGYKNLTSGHTDSGASRINEKTILETLPPEELMKYVGTKDPFSQKE